MAMIIEPSLTYKPSFRKDKLIPNFLDLKFQYFPIPLYRALFFNQTYIINKVKKKNWPRPSNPLKLYLKNFGVRSIIKIKIDLIAKFKNFYILFFFFTSCNSSVYLFQSIVDQTLSISGMLSMVSINMYVQHTCIFYLNCNCLE